MNLTEFLKQMGDIISKSANNPLGVLALILMLLSFIALKFFESSSEEIKMAMYILLTFCFVFSGGVIVFQTRSTSRQTLTQPPIVTNTRKHSSKKLYYFTAIAVFVSLLVYWDLAWRLQDEYFKNYKAVNGVWLGIDQVSSDDAKHMARVYRFTLKGRLGKPTSVHLLNGSGQYPLEGIPSLLGDFTDPCSSRRAAIVRFVYNDRGEIAHESIFDQADRPIVSMSYTPQNPFVARFQYATGASCPLTPSGAEAIKVMRVQSGINAGLNKEVYFLNTDLLPRPEKNGHFGFRFEYDDQGRLIRKMQLGFTGQPIGVVVSLQYDSSGNLIEKAFWDVNENRIFNADGIAIVRYHYDQYGNNTERIFLDDSRQAVHSVLGCAKITFKYDQYGNMIEEAYFSKDNKPTQLKNERYVRYVANYDKHGNRIKTMMYDAFDKLTTISAGYAMRKAEWDADGNQISDSYFDVDGKPTNSKNGYASKRMAYNQNGFRISERYYDENNHKTVDQEGKHEWNLEFDKKGNRKKLKYFDENTKPISIDGVHAFEFSYDANNNMIEKITLDEFLKPTLNKNGGCRYVIAYDDYGRKKFWDVYDCVNKCTVDNTGIHRFAYRYNSRGQKESESYFDCKLNPSADNEGTHSIKFEYDELGQELKQAYYDKNEKLALGSRGYASIKFDRDLLGRVVNTSYFGVDDQPVQHDDGYFSETKQYNTHGELLVKSFHDKAGNLTTSKPGYAKIIRTYDERHQMIQEEHYNASGELVNLEDGYATLKRTYDNKGNVASSMLFDSHSKKFSSKEYPFQIKYIYDKYNRKAEIRYFSTSQEPTNGPNGAHLERYLHNKKGKIISLSYFDVSEIPIMHEGYSSLIYQYDSFGNQIKRIFKGINGNTIKNAAGIAIIDEKRDKFGHLIEKRYYDEDNKPINGNHEAPFHLTVYEYDNYGRQTKKAYFNVRGDNAADEHGIHKETIDYRPDGKILEKNYFDVFGNRVEKKNT